MTRVLPPTALARSIRLQSVLEVGEQRSASTAFPDPLDSFLDLVVERLIPPLTAELATTFSHFQPEAEPWRLLNVDEVATRLGRSTRWVRERVKRGQLPHVRLDGGALAFEIEDVQAFAAARRISAAEPPALAT